MHSTSNTQSIPRAQEEMGKDGHEGARKPLSPQGLPSYPLLLHAALVSVALSEEDVTVVSHFCREDVVALSPLKGQWCWQLLNMDGFIDLVRTRAALKVVPASEALSGERAAVVSLENNLVLFGDARGCGALW